MSKNSNILLDYLLQKKQWVTSLELSSVLGVSKRQIANYVSELNTNAVVVVSSPKGYKISPNYEENKPDTSDSYSPKTRQNILLHMLCFSKGGIDVYDTADALFVSSSTLENDLNQIKSKLSSFELKISKKKDIYNLSGTENNIRKFIIIELFHNNLDEFYQQFENETAFSDMRNFVRKTIQKRGIFINDYSLALFCLNLCVGIKRCMLDYMIRSRPVDNDLPKEYLDTVSELCDYIRDVFHINLDECEQKWILDSLSSSSTLWDPKTINIHNLSMFVEDRYIQITKDLIEKVKENFPNTRFEEDFLVRFAIHIRNCFIQKDYETYNIDTLTKRIKYDYPTIFEVAVFIADYLENNYGLSMTQNELTYIAFHICSSLADFTDFQVTITFVYADYWNYHKKVLDQLIGCIGDKGIIKQTVSISDYVPSLYHSDMIVTDSGARLPEPCIRISSLPSKENTLAVANYVDKLYLQKQYNYFINNFENYFNKSLFMHYSGNDYLELLQIMCMNAKKINLINDDFFEDILKRERLDNTAFNLVAIPHTLTVSSNKTFLSVAICDDRLKWGPSENFVKIVVMLGINENDRKAFSIMYDFLVNLLSNNQFILELSKTNSFEEFINKVAELAEQFDSFEY